MQTHGFRAQGRITFVHNRKTARWQQPVGLQLFAAQADHHHLAAKVGVAADVAQGADGNRCVGRVNGHTTPVGMLQAHHVVHVRVQRQQFGLDACHCQRHHTGNTLHRGGDGQNVACTHGAVHIDVAFEGVAFQRLKRCWFHRRQGQTGQDTGSRHVDQAFVHPAASGNFRLGVTDWHVVP